MRMRIDEKLVKAIKDYILEDEENPEEVKNELRRYRKEFAWEKDYNWYKYGNILPYYSQIRDFYLEHGIPVPESNSMLQEHFEYHVGKAIDSRNKIKYTCRCCGLTVWGKPNLDISCNECQETLDEEEREEK